MAVPKITLRTGARMPMLGLGTWKSEPNKVKQAVITAIGAGYRHIDCAYAYKNEHEVGEAIHTMLRDGRVKREDLFITSKLWLTYFSPDRVQRGIEKTLENLKLDYLDLYLLHWPFALKFTTPNDLYPKYACGEPMLDEDTDYVDTWKAVIKLNGKLSKAIGISNFKEYQIKRLMKETSVTPDVHQFECHPYLNQDSLVKFCQARGIAVTGYSPFGSLRGRMDGPDLFQEPSLKQIAEKYNKNVTHVLLRYQIQRGIVTIPKSVNSSRIIDNFLIFDFQLSDKDMETIANLNRDWRVVDVDRFASRSCKYYPFREDYSE